jgi:hypothetical protein
LDLNERVKTRLAGVLRMHVLGSVRKHVEAGQLDFVTEIRHLTVLFMGFPGLTQPAECSEPQQAAQACRRLCLGLLAIFDESSVTCVSLPLCGLLVLPMQLRLHAIWRQTAGSKQSDLQKAAPGCYDISC